MDVRERDLVSALRYEEIKKDEVICEMYCVCVVVVKVEVYVLCFFVKFLYS